MNQCMGCQAGWPRLQDQYGWWHPVIGGYPRERVACTKELYSMNIGELDDLIDFALHCTSYKRAIRRGVEPLTFEQFAEAVNERMPEKTEEEKAYLLRRFHEAYTPA